MAVGLRRCVRCSPKSSDDGFYELKGLSALMMSPIRKSLFFALITVLLSFGVTQLANAQKLNRNRPSVYITFKEFLEKTPDPAHPSQGARLEVHNNTRWPIYFTEHYDPTVAGSQISYLIEREDGCPELRRYSDVVMQRKVM